MSCKFAIKRDTQAPKNLRELPKGIEHLQLNVFDKLHFLGTDSEHFLLIGSLLLKSCYEHDTFRYDLMNNVCGRRDPSQTFFWVWFHLPKFQEIVLGEVTF